MRACHGSAIAATPSPSDAPDHGGLEGEGRRERCPERDGSRITNTIHFWGWVHHHHQPNQIWPAGPDGTVVIGCNLASVTRGSEGQHHNDVRGARKHAGYQLQCVDDWAAGKWARPGGEGWRTTKELDAIGLPEQCFQNGDCLDRIPPHDAEGYMWLYIEASRI